MEKSAGLIIVLLRAVYSLLLLLESLFLLVFWSLVVDYLFSYILVSCCVSWVFESIFSLIWENSQWVSFETLLFLHSFFFWGLISCRLNFPILFSLFSKINMSGQRKPLSSPVQLKNGQLYLQKCNLLDPLVQEMHLNQWALLRAAKLPWNLPGWGASCHRCSPSFSWAAARAAYCVGRIAS